MSNELSQSERQRQARLQQLQQNILTLQQQKNVAQEGIEEVKSALEELSTGKHGGVVYKQVGQLLIKADPDVVIKELEEKQRNLQSYLKRVELQYDKQLKKIKEVQSEAKNIRTAG
ncbi:MAG: prefoldin subunit [Candidatus Ranarchaeia archaeon]